jgi:hypothetical protein
MPEDQAAGSSRYDRELLELLNELRVALPGVQVLFAFLLTVPFTQRWGDVTAFQRDVFFVVLLLAAASTVLLMAPTAFHRIRFRRRDKQMLLRAANVMTIAGLGLLALAMTGAVLLIADLLFSRTQAWIVGAVVFAAFAAVWFLVPLSRHLVEPDDGGGRAAAEAPPGPAAPG